MDKNGRLILYGALLAVALLIASLAMAAPKGLKACRDGSDNDGDGYVDLADPGCANKNDRSELDPNVECDDGSDNDGDSAVDYNDVGCSGPTDTDESNCGDAVCEGTEDCDNCAADCLGGGEVCCNGVAYTGECCDNNDCTSPEECFDYYCVMPDSCSDTDGGFVEDVQGTVSGYDDELWYSDTDFCHNSTFLEEYYCGGTTPYSFVTGCWGNWTSCVDGACI